MPRTLPWLLSTIFIVPENPEQNDQKFEKRKK